MSGIEVLQSAELGQLARFDAIIDVRSPAEFAEDHVPGAINLPVLDNAERAEVGTIYVQESRFKARKVGAALIARNVARHLESALADRPGAFRPLIYCWRGGQRSHAMALILSQVGWRTTLLDGGWRTWRRHVTARLYDGELALKPVLLDGNTGVGKTEILHLLAERGAQVLDLEGLAGHRGSLFGALPDRPQPSQKMFESRLLAALDGLDPDRPVVLEAESSKIGERMLPPALWRAMQTAPRIVLAAPPPARAAYLVRAYGDVVRDPEQLRAVLERLPDRPGRKRLASWLELAASGAFEELAAALIEVHYDPAYRRSAKRETRGSIGEIGLERLEPGDLARAADAVIAILRSGNLGG